MITLKEAKQNLIDITWNPIKLLVLVWVADPLKGAIKFQEWPHLLKIIWVLLRKRLVIIVKARQIGISWLLAIYALWIIMVILYVFFVIKIYTRLENSFLKRKWALFGFGMAGLISTLFILAFSNTFLMPSQRIYNYVASTILWYVSLPAMHYGNLKRT